VSNTRTNHFSFRRVTFCMLPLFGLALWIVALGSLANAGGTATAETPARVAVKVPAVAKSSGVVMLELAIAVVRKPASGQLGAVVRLRQPGGGSVELGRVSLVGGQQSYQFNVGSGLSGGSADVEVALVDRGGGPAPSGAELSIGRAQFIMR
jgi:hypothetical protein